MTATHSNGRPRRHTATRIAPLVTPYSRLTEPGCHSAFAKASRSLISSGSTLPESGTRNVTLSM